MPSPIIHLNVLMRVIHAIQFPISSDLVLGCISPDAIHMRPNQTWIDKATTHFYEIADDSLIDAIQTARQMLGHLSSDFRRGYLIHLYTDYLWRERIYTPYFCTYKETMIRADLHALYYRDMQRIDTVFLKDVESAIPYLKNAVSKIVLLY